MPIKPKKIKNGKFLPAGRHVCKVASITDLPQQETPYGTKDQLLIEWKSTTIADAAPVREWVNNSFHEDATLTNIMQCAFGEDIALAVVDDLEILLGKQVELQLVLNPKGFPKVKGHYPVKHKNVHGVEITDDDLPAALQ